MFIAASIVITTSSMPTVYAADRNDKIIKTVETASKILEDGICTSLNNTEKNIKKECLTNDYDYYLTMQSFYQQGNPYKDADYIELIAAYITAKNNTNTLEQNDFYSLPFVEANIEPSYIKEYTPIEVTRYIEESDGIYIQDGTYLIDTPTTINTYTEIADNKFKLDGEKKVNLKSVNTQYGKVTLSSMSAQDILTFYNLEQNKKVQKKYEDKVNQLKKIINGNFVNESLFLSFQESNINDSTKNYIETLMNKEDISLNRKKTILTGVSLLGKVPYEWGGKASKAGYDKTWWSLNEEGSQKGLDCSGYIQWILITAGYNQNIYSKCLSTSSTLASLEAIAEDDLIPGDIGFLHSAELETVNHVGMYLGNGKWMHCSSGSGTTVIENTDMFKVFRRLPEIDTELNTDLTEALLKADIGPKEIEINTVDTYNSECPYSDEDVLLAAKLMYNEANAEGLNGWIAVCEVLKNRLESDIFPDTISEVIYQENQFADSDKIEGRNPSEEMIKTAKEVLSGNLSVLNNKNILFFRNAKGSIDNWGKYVFEKSVGNHQFYSYS